MRKEFEKGHARLPRETRSAATRASTCAIEGAELVLALVDGLCRVRISLRPYEFTRTTCRTVARGRPKLLGFRLRRYITPDARLFVRIVSAELYVFFVACLSIIACAVRRLRLHAAYGTKRAVSGGRRFEIVISSWSYDTNQNRRRSAAYYRFSRRP